MKVALQTVSEKWDAKMMRSWKADIEKAFIQINSLTVVKPTPWTPILRGTTAAGAPTYVTQFGEWSQIDCRVFFNCYVRISAIGGMTGAVQLAGLPLLSRNVANSYQIHAMRWNNVTLAAAGTGIVAQQTAGTAFFDLLELVNTGSAIVLPVTALTATTDFIISGSYAT